jgi:hypothetical protein
MLELASANLPGSPYIWAVPANVTHVMVEMWGGGAGAGGITNGGGGGAYSRSVLAVTPNTAYAINVGTGGALLQDGGNSNFSAVGGAELLHAQGGSSMGAGGSADSRANLARAGMDGKIAPAGGGGGAAFGAFFCPGPFGETTGHGGDLLSAGNPGYVLLTW